MVVMDALLHSRFLQNFSLFHLLNLVTSQLHPFHPSMDAQADTMEDLQDWKAALENALTQAPSASHVMGQNGIFRNDHAEAPAGVDEQSMFVTFFIF